jgi:hypothetical protein
MIMVPPVQYMLSKIDFYMTADPMRRYLGQFVGLALISSFDE